VSTVILTSDCCLRAKRIAFCYVRSLWNATEVCVLTNGLQPPVTCVSKDETPVQLATRVVELFETLINSEPREDYCL
jgi:hypothetical protein